MTDFDTIKLVPIIGATFVGTFVLYAVIKILPNLRTDTSAPLDSSVYHSARGSSTRREGGRKSKKNSHK